MKRVGYLGGPRETDWQRGVVQEMRHSDGRGYRDQKREAGGARKRGGYLAACAAAPRRLPIAMTSCGTASRLPPIALSGMEACVAPPIEEETPPAEDDDDDEDIDEEEGEPLEAESDEDTTELAVLEVCADDDALEVLQKGR